MSRFTDATLALCEGLAKEAPTARSPSDLGLALANKRGQGRVFLASIVKHKPDLFKSL
jgi:hypothetical protein